MDFLRDHQLLGKWYPGGFGIHFPFPDLENCGSGQNNARGKVENSPNGSSFFHTSGAGTLVSLAVPGDVSGGAGPAAVSGGPLASAFPGRWVFAGLFVASAVRGLSVFPGWPVVFVVRGLSVVRG